MNRHYGHLLEREIETKKKQMAQAPTVVEGRRRGQEAICLMCAVLSSCLKIIKSKQQMKLHLILGKRLKII